MKVQHSSQKLFFAFFLLSTDPVSFWELKAAGLKTSNDILTSKSQTKLSNCLSNSFLYIWITLIKSYSAISTKLLSPEHIDWNRLPCVYSRFAVFIIWNDKSRGYRDKINWVLWTLSGNDFRGFVQAQRCFKLKFDMVTVR